MISVAVVLDLTIPSGSWPLEPRDRIVRGLVVVVVAVGPVASGLAFAVCRSLHPSFEVPEQHILLLVAACMMRNGRKRGESEGVGPGMRPMCTSHRIARLNAQ